MTPSLFRTFPFIENAFARRFQAMLSFARYNRSWHVLVADSGAGKTTCIRDLQKRAGGRSILAVVTPMMFLKEVTDQGRLQYDHPLGLCLVAAGRGNTIPLKEILDQSEPTWLQWRRRLDPMQPFCRIAGHTSEEILEILATLETVFQPLLPQLNLRQWTSSIYDWLTLIVLDPASSGRVSMDNLMKLVLAALEWSYEAKATDVQVEYLERAAALLVLRHDTFWIIDGEGPEDKTEQAAEAVKEAASETPAQQVLSPNEEQAPPSTLDPEDGTVDQKTRKPKGRVGESSPHQDQGGTGQQEGAVTHCSFSGPIQLETSRWLASKVQEVQCSMCGSVSKARLKEQSVVIASHPPRKSRPVRNVTRWMEQGLEWVLAQKKE